MSTAKFSDDFKRDAVQQIVERGYPVAEVSTRLGVSPHSLYAWKKRFANLVKGILGKIDVAFACFGMSIFDDLTIGNGAFGNAKRV